MFKKIGIALALSVASILPAVANEPGDLYIGEYGSEGCGDAIYCLKSFPLTGRYWMF